MRYRVGKNLIDNDQYDTRDYIISYYIKKKFNPLLNKRVVY